MEEENVALVQSASTQSLSLYDAERWVDGVVRAWLHECGKNSQRTEQAYDAYMLSFRCYLSIIGYDVFLPMRKPPHDADQEHKDTISYAAQAWASTPNSRTGRAVSNSTHNLRLSAISSFYTYAIIHHECYGPNPMDAIKRMRRPMYKGVAPLPYKNGEVVAALDAIPLDTPNGIRDKALLSLTLYTGRRLADIASLTFADMRISATQIAITWPHMKGDKEGKNILEKKRTPAYADVMHWIREHHTSQGLVFYSLSNNHYGQQLTPQAIGQICNKWFETSRFHRLRHTFAAAYLSAGGDVLGLQKALGHSNLGVTSVYAHSLDDGTNEYQGAMRDVYAGREPKKS